MSKKFQKLVILIMLFGLLGSTAALCLVYMLK